MKYMVFKSTMPALAVITKFTTAALMLVALAACNSGGSSGGGGGDDTKKTTPIPLEPTNLVATGVNQGIDLSWDAAKDATSYTVYYSKASFAKDKTADSGVKSKTDIKTTNASITGLTDGTKYYLRVEAITAAGSHLSEIVTATTKATVITIPQAPTNLQATGKKNAIDLSWSAVTVATSYTVYYSTASFDKTSDSLGSTTDITKDTTASITGLLNGTEYFIRLVASNAKGDSVLSEEVSAITELPAPINLQATGKKNAIDLTWDAVTGATSYKVYYSKVSFSDTTGLSPKTVQSPALSTSIASLENGTEYFIRLVASNTKGDSVLSGEKSAITILPAPTKVVAKGGDELVDLSWDVVDKATSYTVYYHKANKFDSTTVGVKEKTTNTTSIRITDLSADTNYHFRVIASNAIASSALSEIQSTHTESKVNPTLSAPTNVMATAGDKTVDINWTAVTGADSYKVYYHTASFSSPTDSGVKSKTDITTDNTTITGLKNGTEYFIRLVATDADATGDSALSAVVSAITKLPAPTKLGATGKDKAIDLTWDAVDDAAKYTVYYSKASFDDTSDSGVKSKTGITTDNTSIIDLSADTTYYFRVIAVNPKISSALSDIKSAATKLPAPTGVVATARDNTVDISWKAVTGATSYTVYYHTASFDKTADSGVKSKTDITTDGNTASTSITGLANGTEYFFKVIASNTKGDSGLSTVVSAITKLPAPINLQATGKDKAIDLSWDVVTGADSYKVYYHRSSFDSTNLGDARGKTTGTTSISIAGLPAGAIYYFRVIAIKGKISSALSEIKSVTTKRPAPQPSAVTSISRLAAVDLSWGDVAGVTGYAIYYAKDSLDGLNGGYLNYGSVKGKLERTSDTSITIDDLSADTTYYFVVAADYGGEESAASEVTADSSYIAELAVGGDHGCVRLNTGSIKCWGNNIKGQLGVGDVTPRKTATSVPNLRAKQLSAGGSHSCAIDLSDMLHCWGDNVSSQLGLSSGSNYYSPALVTQTNLAKVSLVTAGNDSTCALAGGTNYCWGQSVFGGLGDGGKSKTTNIAQPIDNILLGVKQFALGKYSGCAIDASNDLWCWGHNNLGQVGDDTTTDRTSPVKPKLKGDSKATMVAGGSEHYCAVDDDKKIQCWGWNLQGQLGIGNAVDSNIPQYVITSRTTSVPLSNVSNVATGSNYSCALIAGGSVSCWGLGADGRIGTDGGNDRAVADTYVQDINNAIDIAAGGDFTCVLLADKASVKCWGDNANGQLGKTTTSTSSHTPVSVDGLKEIYQ